MTVVDISPDKSQPDGHFEIKLKENPNHAAESTRNEVIQLFSDNIAFPITYRSTAYAGNAKLQEAVGYVIDKKESDRWDKRYIFVKDHLFIVTDWKSKDDYYIRYILKSKNAPADKTEKKEKKKKKGFFKSLKEGIKNAKAGGGGSIEKLKAEVLQPYLDKATVKQKAYYPEWIKVTENLKTKEFMEDQAVLMKKAMKQYNDDIFNSPEYQRMLAYRRWLDNSINMTVHNKSGSTIWVGSTKEAFISNEIQSGGSSTENCTSDMYYYYSDAKGTPGKKFYTEDSACGSSVTIN